MLVALSALVDAFQQLIQEPGWTTVRVAFNAIASNNKTEAAVVVAAATAIVHVVWRVLTWLHTRARRWWLVSRREFRVPLEASYEDLNTLGEFQCLIIRHGDNGYLRSIATERERLDGHSQFKVRRVRVEKQKNSGAALLRFTVPVHRRLGTQFKCFATVSGKADDAITMRDHLISVLRSCESTIDDVRPSTSGDPRKVYFALKETPNFAGSYSADGGITNNFIAPL